VGPRQRTAAFLEQASSQRPPARDPGGAREAKALAALGETGLSEREYLDAVGDLVTYGTEASVGALRDALAWTDHMRVRHAAVMALGRIGSLAAIDAIIAGLEFADNITVHRSAFILRVRDERRAVPALVSCVMERGEELGTGTRRRLLRELCWMPSPTSVEPLAPLLRHRNRKVRRQAANAIGAVGDARALAELEAAAKDLGPIRGWRAEMWADQLRKRAAVLPAISEADEDEP
jgi:HEAT repeat protein